MLARPEMVFSREQMMEAAYGPDTYVTDRTIDSHIRNIRAKFAEAGCAASSRRCTASASGSAGPTDGGAARPAEMAADADDDRVRRAADGAGAAGGVVIWFRALDNTRSRMGPIEIGALAVALVLTVVIAVVFSRTITGPINALVERTEEIGRGGRAAIVAPEQQGTREIATLSQSFLDLAERLVDRTEYVSSFAAHV